MSKQKHMYMQHCLCCIYASLHTNSIDLSITKKNRKILRAIEGLLYVITFISYIGASLVTTHWQHSQYLVITIQISSPVVMMMQYFYNRWPQENKPGQNLISQMLLVTSRFPSHSASCIVWFSVCIISVLSPTLQISLLSQMTSMGIFYLY